MKCKSCGSESYNIRIIYRDGQSIEGCSKCLYATPMCDFRNTETMILSNGKTVSIGVGHRRDIEKRWIDRKTGKVFLKTNKRYFCSTSTGGRK